MLAEDTHRLKVIDGLYELRLDKYVSLPMLVVVGDQSSGKSSVLEGMLGLPLPRDSALCTRFPTQIVYKRSPKKSVEAMIMPLKEPVGEKAKMLEDFSKRNVLDPDKFDSAAFESIMLDACKCMGLPQVGQDRSPEQSAFSHDVLKLELSGPSFEHFSVVDLPGLFRKPTEGQTTKEDIILVRNMVGRYLNNPRSILLVVVPANVDIATQEIVQMALDADPDRERTLGVLTKPDLVDKGAEDKILDLMTVGSKSHGLGYTVVCNRGQSELATSSAQRNSRERSFFSSEPWNKVPENRAGVEALKLLLNKLLVKITRQHFRSVEFDISNALSEAREKLSGYARPRTGLAEQRIYLLNIASNFRSLVSRAIDAYYGRDECFRKYPELKIANKIMRSHESFSEQMFQVGLARKFMAPTIEAEEPAGGEDPVQDPQKSFQIAVPSESSDDESSTGMSASPAQRHPELRQILKDRIDRVGAPKEDIKHWISRMHKESKGFEVATINPSLLPSLFAEQTKPWQGLATNHVIEVITQIHEFLSRMLHYICDDFDVATKLWSKLISKLLQAYQRALSHADFLFNVETNGNPITVNHYFAENLKKARLARMQRRLQDSLKSKFTVPYDPNNPSKIYTIAAQTQIDCAMKAYTSNEDQEVQDLHDALQAYYKVARKRFVDAVCKQAIDHFLICAKDSPFCVFSAEFVGAMSDDEISQLAGESPELVEQRQQLTAEVERLEQGKAIIQG